MFGPGEVRLADGEVVLWYGYRSWRSVIPYIIIGLITLFVMGLGLIIILFAILQKIGSVYAITNKRVYCRYGKFSRRIVETTYDKITDITVYQGILGRLLQYGDVRVNTAGSPFSEVNLYGVDDPQFVESKIRQAMENYTQTQRIRDMMDRLQERYLLGEISWEQLQMAKRRLMGGYR